MFFLKRRLISMYSISKSAVERRETFFYDHVQVCTTYRREIFYCGPQNGFMGSCDLKPDHDLELSEKIEIFINKMQTVVKIFRRSPVKNDVLPKNCQAEFNKEINLIMDTKT